MLIEDNINPIEENIERFCSYFSRQLIVLRALTLNNNQLESTRKLGSDQDKTLATKT